MDLFRVWGLATAIALLGFGFSLPAQAESNRLEVRSFKATKVDKKNGIVKLTWRGPKSARPVSHFQIFRNQVKVGQTSGRAFVDKKIPFGNVEYKIVVVYENGEFVPTNKTIQLKIPFRGFGQ